MRKMINVCDEEKANVLINNGFHYILDTVFIDGSQKRLYKFIISDELMNYLLTNFDDKSYTIETTLHF